MTEPTSPTVDQPTGPPAISPRPSPLLPQHLIDLFVRPRRFFLGQLALGKTPYAVFVAWCYGASSAIDSIDPELVQPRSDLEAVAPYVLDSWLGYWALVAVLGALSGLFLWWLGGW